LPVNPTAWHRVLPNYSLRWGCLFSVFVFGRLAGLPKNCICGELSKDIHNVSLRPCQEKFFAFNEQPAIFEPLKHTSNDTLELDHDACPPVNSFTPNRLILTIFNESGCGDAWRAFQGIMLSITWEDLWWHAGQGPQAEARATSLAEAWCRLKSAAGAQQPRVR
jgi:hypothetical protein